MARRAVKILLAAALVLALVLAAYVVYIFAAWYRLEDWQALEIAAPAEAGEGLALGETYRLVSYNVGFGAYSPDFTFFMDGGTESHGRSAQAVRANLNGAVEAIQGLDPDLILLQEVDVSGTRGCDVDQLAMVREAFGGAFWSTFAQNNDNPYFLWPPLDPYGSSVSGLTTLSRFPVASAVRRQLPIETGVMKLVDLDRCYAVHRLPVDGGRELVLYNIHLSAYTSDGTIAEEQLKMLFADMLAEYEAGNWVVGGGDFNKDLLGNSDEIFGISGPAYTWAQPIPEELVPEDLAILAPLDEADPVASCRNADRPYGPDSYLVTVDGFIVSDNVSVSASRVADTGFQWSDHNPVYLDFILLNE